MQRWNGRQLWVAATATEALLPPLPPSPGCHPRTFARPAQSCGSNTHRIRGHLCTQVIELITKAARKGATPSQIGVLLRDQHGINQVRSVVLGA